MIPGADFTYVEGRLGLLSKPTRVAAYDFDVRSAFACSSRTPETSVPTIARLGPIPNYEEVYRELESSGIRLCNSPAEHLMASELTHWYSRLQDCTPRSMWFDEPPDASTIEASFDWPVFIKGSRQTARHARSLSIAASPDDFHRIMAAYRDDPILHWQTIIVREHVRLRRVGGGVPDEVPRAFEYRTFWWHGTLVGAGPYWGGEPRFAWTDSEREAGLMLARHVTKRLDVPFLVVDLAMRDDGQWTVIECNDGQESGYAGCSGLAVWNGLVEARAEPVAAEPTERASRPSR